MDTESRDAPGQRMIELQSPEDLSYLIANVRRAAAGRLDEAFPQIEGAEGEDELRSQIETLVEQYIVNTFTYASDNLSINGLAVSADRFLPSTSSTTVLSPSKRAQEVTYEPFDARKRQRVADLITQEEKLLEEVATLKRSVPQEVASARADKLRDAVKMDQDLVQETVRRIQESHFDGDAVGREAEGDGDGVGAKIRVDALDRQDDMEAGFKQAVTELGKLKREMPSVVARMQRAKDAGEYVMMTGRR